MSNAVNLWAQALGGINAAGVEEAVTHHVLSALCSESCKRNSELGDYISNLHQARCQWESETGNRIDYASIAVHSMDEGSLTPNRRNSRVLRSEDSDEIAEQRGATCVASPKPSSPTLR